MILYKLKNIASVQPGYPFRSRLEHEVGGNISVIQLRNIGDDGLFNPTNLSRIMMHNIEKHHLLKPQDIVFRSRGQTNKAAIISEDFGQSIVAGPLLRIRVTDDKVIPTYLAWYINQAAAQAYLARHSKGTASRMIGKHAVEDMEIPVPAREVQQKIIELANLSAKEQQLIQTLARKRKYYMEHMMMKLVSGK